MNPQEQQRIIILTQVVSKTPAVSEAAVQMGMCERQTKRLRVGVAVVGETKPGRTLRGDRAVVSGVTKSLNNESDRFTGL